MKDVALILRLAGEWGRISADGKIDFSEMVSATRTAIEAFGGSSEKAEAVMSGFAAAISPEGEGGHDVTLHEAMLLAAAVVKASGLGERVLFRADSISIDLKGD